MNCLTSCFPPHSNGVTGRDKAGSGEDCFRQLSPHTPYRARSESGRIVPVPAVLLIFALILPVLILIILVLVLVLLILLVLLVLRGLPVALRIAAMAILRVLVILVLRHCKSLPFVFTVSMCTQCPKYTMNLYPLFFGRFAVPLLSIAVIFVIIRCCNFILINTIDK